jgi:peptidoglycan-associated lipoprotein
MKPSRFVVTTIAVCGCWLSGCARNHPIAAKTPTPVSAPVTADATPRPKPAAVAERIAPEPKPLPSRYPDAATRDKIETLLSRIQDAYFDYDKHFLRPDAMTVLSADAKTLSDILRQYPDFKLRVEGYCDERGSAEYNLALGDARAVKAKEFLVNLGLPGAQMNVISLGKETQVCADHTEACWQKNRRAHVATADSRIHQ